MQTAQLVIPLFIVMALGYYLKKSSFFSRSAVDELNRFVFYIALPTTLFTQTATISEAISQTGVAALMQPLAIIGTAVVALIISLRMDAVRRGPFIQASYRSNMAYLGLPIASTVFGEASLGIIAITIAAGVVTNSVVSIVVLRMFDPAGGNGSPWRRLLDVARNPLIIAIALGLSFSFLELSIPPLLEDTLALVQRVSLPLVLLIVGFSFSFTRIGRQWPIAVGAATLKLAAMPLLAWVLLTYGFGADGLVRSTIVLMTAMPTAVASQSFAAAFNADEQLAAAAVSFSTLASLITIPLWVGLL